MKKLTILQSNRNLAVFLGALWMAVVAQPPSLEAFTLQQGSPTAQLIQKPVALMAGAYHTCAVMSDKSVKCWGRNSRGQIGDGGTIGFNNYKTSPTKVAGLSGATDLAGGNEHTCALLEDGAVECWGANAYGQLGSGSSSPSQSSSPLAVAGLDDVAFLGAGYDSTCAVKTEGGTFCWGRDERATSVGGITYNYSPIKIDGAGRAQMAAMGGFHTCVLREDGTVKCWGWDGSGQVGDGGGIDEQEFQEVPTPVVGLADVVSIGLGEEHSCAVKEDGSAWCWGDSYHAQLGENLPTDRSTPVPVQGGLTDVVQIDGGDEHTCALTSGGKVYCWGWNTSGQIGVSGGGSHTLPVLVPGLSGVKEIAVGAQHTCALIPNILAKTASIKCWGNNAFGQLGDGTTANQYGPVTVNW